jgi:hypothetical protein
MLLICPIMHIGMMVFMMKGNKKEDCHQTGSVGDQK